MAQPAPRIATPLIAERDRVEFVRQWTREIIRTSYVPLARQDIEAFLAARFDEILASLLDDDFSTGPAAEVGARMVRVHFTSPVALERTMSLLATGIPKLLAAADAEHLSRLTAISGALAAGFTEQLREQIFDQQEVIKKAVLEARDQAVEALRASEARSRAVFTSSVLGIAIADLHGTIEEVNFSMEQIFLTAEGLVGRTVFELVDDDWLEVLRTADVELVDGSLERFQTETRFTAADGTRIWTQVSASLVRDARGEPDYQVLLYEDITDRHLLQEQLQRQATHDPLTGLANRTLLKTRLDIALEPSSPERRVGLCYFDLDGFKAVNDSLGHPIGDDLLRVIAQRLQVIAHQHGALAVRLGGDEFVVLVPDSQGVPAMLDLVQTMLDEITRPARIAGHELKVSASAGVVERAVVGTRPDELLRDADITLYRAKNEGKAQWMLFDAEINELTRTRFELSATMPSALDDNEFFVEYRPIVRLDGSALVAVEADVRWDHAGLGELGAEVFLDLAKETGLITRLGNWVLEQVCQHAVRWADRLGSAAPVASITLSERHFCGPDLVGDLQRILRATGLPAEKLWLAVPESALFDPQGDPLDTIEILRAMGVRLVVEDFGGDYSRLARLRQLPVEAVRISGPYLQSFAAPDGPDPVDEHILASLLGAAELMELTVVVDGVHTGEQATRLRRMGVTVVQGDHVGGLASAMEIEATIAAQQ